MPSASTDVGGRQAPALSSRAPTVPAVELVDLTKFYPKRRATDGSPIASVDHVNLTIDAGQVYGLLGPNGAGKSTTIRMIATLLEPTSGQVRVGGLDTRTHEREIRAMLGVALGGERSVYWKLTARQNLEYFAALHGHSRRRSQRRIIEVLDQMELADRADDHIETWSTGMRQRLVMARALLNHPQVLLLDEPSSGLDPHASQNMHERIVALKDMGHTILLTTHDMAEADSLSDRLGIIDGGKLVGEGTSAQLKRSVGVTTIAHARIIARSSADVDNLVLDLAGAATTTVESEGQDGYTLTLRGDLGDELIPTFISAALRHGVTVLRLENEPVSLKDVFLALTGRRLSAEPDPS
ncbi:ABC transporter ATP-binding protein [Micromonospora sp. NPDC049044]|uniref:ABC transporter ATP-binding protein n=1 Tax=unclassified Micromonospora TaxID=2617518 RepID=UPI0033D208A7